MIETIKRPITGGWFDFKEQRFVFIFSKYILLNMCFPYGIKVEESEKKSGKAYRIEILEIIK